jgi:hypothetical protein
LLQGLDLADRGRFPYAYTYCILTTVGLRLHSMIVAPNIQQEPVTSASEILNENVLSCVEVVLNMWNHCRVIMQVATMK